MSVRPSEYVPRLVTMLGVPASPSSCGSRAAWRLPVTRTSTAARASSVAAASGALGSGVTMASYRFENLAAPLVPHVSKLARSASVPARRSEEHTSELQSHRDLHSFPTRRSSDLVGVGRDHGIVQVREPRGPARAARKQAREER